MDSFLSWLSQFRVQKGERYSHLGLDTFRGAFYIPDEHKNEFHKRYFEHVFVSGLKCDLVEKHKDLCCLLYDLDFKIPKESTERAYTLDKIKNFIECVTRILSQYIDTSLSHTFDAYVCEKKEPTTKKDWKKDGIHIMFPHIVTEPALQHYFRAELVMECKHIFHECINDIEDIIDETVLEKNGWMMYGASKTDGFPYKLTGIWGYSEIEEVGNTLPTRITTSEFNTDTVELVNFLSIRRYITADVSPIKDGMQDIIDSWISQYHSESKSDLIRPRQYHQRITNGYTDLNTVQSLVEILSVERAKERNLWMQVGWCLHNISETLLNCWITFSQRCEQYSSTAEEDCKREWDKMEKKDMSIGSLHMWAKKDNEKAYIEITRNDLEYYISTTVCRVGNKNMGPKGKRLTAVALIDLVFHIVSAFKHKYGHIFVCGGYEKKIWYEFRNNRWEKDDADIGFKIKVVDELFNDFMNVSKNIRFRAEKLSNTHPSKEKYEYTANEISKVASKFKDAAFRNKLALEACEQLYWNRSRQHEDNNFEDILDTKTELISFKNGVYDLENDIFRDTRCEDYVSLSTNIEFEKYSYRDKIVVELQEFISQIIPHKDTRDYVLTVLAGCLSGGRRYEHFHIWLGSGGNGKSKLIELFENSFGDYCSHLSVACICKQRPSSNAASPELAKLRNKRFVVLQEPNQKETIQTGIMKELTGGDKIEARALNCPPIIYQPQFTLLMTCNTLPEVPPHDGGAWRRMKVVKFESEFKEDPNPEKPNEFKLDVNLNQKLEKWKKPFMWLLTEYFKKYRDSPYVEPEPVKKAIEEYRKANDIYYDFVDEYIQANTKDGLPLPPSSVLWLDELYAQYQMWYKATISDSRAPKRKDLEEYITKIFGPPFKKGGKRGWKSLKLRTDDNNDDDDQSDEDYDMVLPQHTTTASAFI